MTHNASYWQKLLVGLILLTTCTTILALSTNRERRRIGIEESSHRPARIETAGSRSLKLSSNKNNAITTEPGRKVSHRLIGGHLKVDTKEEREESLWDDGILMSSAGNGKEGGKNSRGEDDEEKKTLSQQVKEGKYGLIQNELYKDPPKRPGIISYLGNPEVPKDTIKNLGGLDEDEIWLAENHVLVLRGGKFPASDTTQGSGDGTPVWPPIDDYKAPRRQVKIPARPKVPPPFPVQLTDGGPIQIIGLNGSKEIENGTIDYKKDTFYSKEFLEEEGPLLAIISNGTLVSPNFGDIRNLTGDGLPQSLSDEEKRTRPGPSSLNGPPTFYHAIPPGAVFVAPPTNLSDYDDEDQSIYYPPPYSFKYHQDNTTAVPPGPLVPGIILPPPPDFFSSLEEKKPTTTKKYSKRPSTTPPPRPRPTYLPPRKLTTKQSKTSTVSSVTTKVRVVPSTTTKLYRRPTYKNISRTVTPHVVKTMRPYVEVSTIVPDKPTTVDTAEFYTTSPVVGNQVSDTNVKGKSVTWSEMVTSKTIPALTYYPSTTPSAIEKPIEVTPASIKNIITTSGPDRSPNQASYYFYEESNSENAGITPTPTPLRFQTTTESPPYYEPPSREEQAKKEYYSVETVPSQQTAKDYSIKFIDSLVKNSQVVQYNEPGTVQTTSKFESIGTRAQNQRMLPENTGIYYPSVPARPIPETQPYYSNPTTPKPVNRYRQEPKPKPIYQYSFQATDYTKRGGSQKYSYSPPEQSTVYNDYQDLKNNRHQYVYEESTPTPEQYRPESETYGTQQRPLYPFTTEHSVIDTTPNPQHAYFTQQDEKLLDDVTKEYFTIFGKKISGSRGLPSTTPIYGKSSSITERPDYNVNSYVQNNYNTAEAPIYKTPNVKVHYGDQSQRPYSLKDDTLVNYKQPLPPINPDSEFITKADQKLPPLYSLKGDTLVNYRQPLPPINPDSEFITIVDPKTPRPYTLINDVLVKLRQPLPHQHENGQPSYGPGDSSPEEIDESYPSQPFSLEHDIDVNYRDPRPTINPDAEFIEPVRDRHTEKPNSYIAYKLPGDSGHFYFLTPRAITPSPEQSRSSRYPKWRYRDDFLPRGLRQRRS